MTKEQEDALLDDPKPAQSYAMTTPLIITPGFWRTRDDRKACAAFTRKGHAVGYIENSHCLMMVWKSNGRYQSGSWTDGADIIAEWVDRPVVPWPFPPWFDAVAMDDDGLWFGHRGKTTYGSSRWISEYKWSIPPEHAPTFTGPWRDSLVQRPQPEGGG